jgi:hypothetical protein
MSVIGKMHGNPTALPAGTLTGRVWQTAHGHFCRLAPENPSFLQIGFGDPHPAGDGLAIGLQRHDAQSLPSGQGCRAFLPNTIVIFMSDNRMPVPNAKTNLDDAGARLRLMVRIVNEGFVNWTDITPTILDWAGVKRLAYSLQGRSFLPVLEQGNPAGWDRLFFSHAFYEVTMHYPARGMRNRQYKYHVNLFSELEFPFASDLFDFDNVAKHRGQAGETGVVGRRKASIYLRRPAGRVV